MLAKIRSAHSVRRTILGLVALALIVTTGFVVSYALPSNEVETYYYSDASKTELVGYRDLLCSGGKIQWGTTSAYYDRYQTPCY